MHLHLKEMLAAHKPTATAQAGIALADHLRVVEQRAGQTVVEFTGTGDFPAQWVTRQRYEISAGQEAEPLLYEPIYHTISDPSLPRFVQVMGVEAGGVIFDEIPEGGEARFMTVRDRGATVPVKHFAVALEYSKDVLIYNELWRLPILERQAGAAFNALKNHLHFAPFLNATYTSANQTAAATVGSTLAEKMLRTVEKAIAASSADSANPRRGPYALLVSGADFFTVERALIGVPQQGIAMQGSAIGRIQHVIAYDGWSGSRGKKSVSYAGVTAGKAYLISLAHRERDHQAYEKQPLQGVAAVGDLSRFVLEQVVYDSYFGVYANPVASTEEITWPTS